MYTEEYAATLALITSAWSRGLEWREALLEFMTGA
jgi:hypothetical protein